MRYPALALVMTLAACSAPVTTRQAPPSVEATASTTAVATGKVEVIGGDEAALRDFIEGYLSPGAYGPPGQDTTIWIGQLPPQPRLAIPVPELAHVIGSLQGPYSALEILFDIDQTLSDVRAYYRETLEAGGWAAPEIASAGGGFVDFPFQLDTYCLAESDAYLTLSGKETAGQPTAVRVSLTMPADYGPCDPSAGAQPSDSFSLIPALTTPPGAVMHDSGAGSGAGAGPGQGYAEAYTHLQSSMTPAELLSHYTTQLNAAGWTLRSSTNAEAFAWSTWNFSDDEGKAWHGMLLAVATPFSAGDEERFVLLRVTSQE